MTQAKIQTLNLTDSGLTGLILVGLPRGVHAEIRSRTHFLFDAMKKDFAGLDAAHQYIREVVDFKLSSRVDPGVPVILYWPLVDSGEFACTFIASQSATVVMRLLPSGLVIDKFRGTDAERDELVERITKG